MRVRAPILILLCSIALIALSLHRSIALFRRTGAVDFRNRVVAARLAAAGTDPYRFKWHSGLSERFYDPSDEPDMAVNRMTSPPTTLGFHALFADWDWNTLKTLNFALNWSCLFAIPFVIGGLTGARRRPGSLGAIALVTAVFALSGHWQFHAERGQQYVYSAFFLSAAASLRGGAGGFFAVLAGFFRPTLGLSAVFVARPERRGRYLAMILISATVLIIPISLWFPSDYWRSYFAASREWYAHAHGVHTRLVGSAIAAVAPGPADGDPFLARYVDFSVGGNFLYHSLDRLLGYIPSYGAGFAATVSLAIVSAIALARARGETIARFSLRFFSAIYLIDLALPAPRSGYNAVLFFPGLLIAASLWDANDRRRDRYPLVALVAGLVWSLNSIVHPLSGPFMVEVFYAIGAVLALFAPAEAVTRSTPPARIG